MKNSHIEWCDHTFNAWLGCTRKSEACRYCYIERTVPLRTRGMKLGDLRVRTGSANWKQPLKWNKVAYADCPECGWSGPYADVCPVPECLALGQEMPVRRPRVFCLSLGDWLDDQVPIEWLADLLKLIQATPNLDWQLLTKRPENFRKRVGAVADGWQSSCVMAVWWMRGVQPDNVWIGATVENQAMANERIPLLYKIPAKVHFLSCEPLLEKLNLEHWLSPCSIFCDHDEDGGGHRSGPSGIEWVICGGESGPNARAMHPDHARSLRDQCQAAGVPFFFKQWGEWVPLHAFVEGKGIEMVITAAGEDVTHRPYKQDYNYTCARMFKVGKKAAGRLLDGIEWNEFPKVEVAA